MSIWVSIGEPVHALNGRTDDANYRAEGEPTAYVEVAIAEGYHDHVRLSVWDDADAQQMTVLLSPAAAREVCRMLAAAAGNPPPDAVVWGEDGESLDLEPAAEDGGPGMTITWDAAGAAKIELPGQNET